MFDYEKLWKALKGTLHSRICIRTLEEVNVSEERSVLKIMNNLESMMAQEEMNEFIKKCK